jgi:hypothetical protein
MPTIEAFLDAVRREVSGQSAWQFTETVHQNDRLSTHEAFNRTSEYLADAMRALGLVDVELIQYPADGRTLVGDWRPSPAWEVESARLEVVEPAARAGVLQRYPETNTCVAILSNPTPRGGLTGALIDVDAPGAPRRLDGRIALTGARPSHRREELVRRGAAAIVSDTLYDPARRLAAPDAVAWDNVWHERWDAPRCPAMLINGRQGQALRTALANGTPVTLRMTVRARVHRGYQLTATGVIQGRRRDEEVVGVGHCSEVGANDNASGCGGLLEAARTLIELRRRKAIPRFERSIRLLFPFECYGTVAWLARTKRAARIIGGINPDMIGEDLGRSGSTLQMHPAADSAPGPGNALICQVLRRLADIDRTFRWIEAEPSINDRSMLSDPKVGGPVPGLVMWPDPIYHSNLDTMSEVSPRYLGLTTAAVATHLGYLAVAGDAEAAELAQETAFHFRRRLEALVREVAVDGRAAPASSPAAREAAARLGTLMHVGSEHIGVCRELTLGRDGGRAAATIDRIVSAWQGDCLATGIRVELDGEEAPEPPAAARRVPIRLEPYLPAGDRLTSAQKAQFQRLAGMAFPWSATLVEILFLVNGHRSIADIHRRVTLMAPLTLQKVLRVFSALERFGYVRL